MKKIGIVTWFDSFNYGTCLQCYALSEFLIRQGFDTFIPESFRYYYGVKHPIQSTKKIIEKVKAKLNPPNQVLTVPKELVDSYEVRKFKNHKFAYERNNIYEIKNRNDYYSMINNSNVFVTGSDQIWNPEYVTPPFLLSFVDKKTKKIAYASSIGVSKIPENKIDFYKKYLSLFDAIGVREIAAKKELEKLIDKEIVTVVDPTLLLDGKFWKNIADGYDNNYDLKQKYIFCYFIGKNDKWQSDVEQFAIKKNLKIYCALSESNLVPNIGQIFPDAGVVDFLALLSKAEYVFTDSFHAVTLSINMNKNFYVYKRFKDFSLNSQNSRITNVLRMFDLKERLITNDNSLNDINDTIAYNITNELLAKERTLSQEFLLRAINN